MLVMARITIRKTLKGELLEERIEILPDDPEPELAFLGQLYAKQLSKDPRFLEFCENYRKEGGGADPAQAPKPDRERFLSPLSHEGR